jgi:formylglycine-generating enzyme required for sulfatase activity
MSLEAWLANSTIFELIPALRDDCKLLKAALDGEDFGFEFNPSHDKWQNLVASLKVPGTREDEGFFGVELFESRLRLITAYRQQGNGFERISFQANLPFILKNFVTAVEKAWGLGTMISSGLLEGTPGEPAWMRSIETKSQGLAKAIKDYVRTNSHWDHPGVLMACDLLMKLMRIDRKPELVVRTKVMFAFEHRKEPKGILANLVIERLPSGSGLLIPHAAHCGLLWMPNNQGDSFSFGLQTAWHAARRYLKSKQIDWKVPHEDFGDLLSYDWRWRLDLSGLHETLPKLGWQNPIVPITGRSAETAIACALIAAAKHNPDNEGLGGSKDIDPLDPNIACTATIDLSRDDLPLGLVASIKTKTLLSEDTLAKERIYEVIVSDQQPAGTIPDNDERFKAIPVATLAEAYEQMVIYPRITRGVNREIAAQTKEDLDTYCTPYITPDIADVNRWQQAASEDPTKYTIYPPENAILNGNTLGDLMAGRLIYEPRLTRNVSGQLAGEASAVALQGNRIFIEGESGLGKSMFLLRCQHEIASDSEALRLPIRFGKTTANDSSLSQVNWSGLTTDELLALKQVSLPVERFIRSLSDQDKPVVPKHRLLSWMEWLMNRGRIVLLLDALDQTHSHGVQQLGPTIAADGWRQCPVIMTARPEAKFDRQGARSDNDWQSLRIVPFDKTRWNRYLETKNIENHVDEAILCIPLLLNMVKSLIADKGDQRFEDQLKGMTRTELYDRAIDHLISRGESIIEADKQDLRDFAKSKSTVKKLLGEIAWVMFQSQGFINQLTGESYDILRNKLPSVNYLDGLAAIDITTSFQLLESTGRSGGLSFRHRSFLEYFLAMYLARKPEDTATNSDSKAESILVPPLNDILWSELIEKIHNVENSLEPSAWSPQAWSNTFRFLLTKCSAPGPSSPLGFQSTDTRDRDSVASKLVQHGNPWIVYQSLQKDGLKLSQGLEAACRWLIHRSWSPWLDGTQAVSGAGRKAEDIRTQAIEFIKLRPNESGWMLNRRYRDGAYLSSLRELIGDKPFHQAYSKDSSLLESLKRLPDGKDGTWNFLESFYRIDGGVFEYGEEPKEVAGKNVRVVSFQMADFPVTNALFELFCPSHRRERNEYSNQDDDPVLYVSWYMAMEFCDWLSTITKQNYGLPTDYEWEWAVRGTNKDRKYWWGDQVRKELVWCDESGAEKTRSRSEAIEAHSSREELYHPTKTKKGTGYGLMDLHGNVWEWASNSELGKSYNRDAFEGSPRFLVGGSWYNGAIYSRCGYGFNYSPVRRYYLIGFRIVLR